MASRSFRFESLGVEMGKEPPLLQVSLPGKRRLGYGREQMLEHVEGDWRHPRGVWSIRHIINFILASSSAAPGVLSIAGFPR